MSKRTILSRPRTRVYDANYNIGESMYKPALDRLNRKYGGRPLSPPTRSTIAPELLERHERAFFDDDLDNCRRRAEKSITSDSFYDSRGARLDARDLMDNFDEETVSRIKSIRAGKKVSAIDDVNMESTVNNITSRRFLDRTDRLLDSVGIAKEDLRRGYEDEMPVTRRALQESSSRRAAEEDVSIKRRSLRFSQEEDTGSREVSRWSAIKDEAETDTGAALRAKQSRARLNDLDDEMEAMAERQAEREKKAARLRALIAEVAEENDVTPPVSVRRALRIKETQEEEVY